MPRASTSNRRWSRRLGAIAVVAAVFQSGRLLPLPATIWCRLFWVFVLLALSPAAPSRAQESNAPAESIRVSVDRVNVGVVVTDPRGNFFEGLHREDFHVLDDGVEQPLTDFAAVDEPAQVVLLVEAGPSVYFLEAGHLRATHAFLDGLSPGDRVAIAKYDEAALPVLPFTRDKQTAEAALVNVRFNMGFGMLNLSRSLSTVLDWLAKAQGKKTIVLLSTGVDTSAPGEAQALYERLKTSDVRLLAMSLSGELRNPPPNPKQKNKPLSEKAVATEQAFAEADQLLRTLTEATGGRAFFPQNARDFAEVYAQIAQLVRHEYSLAFAPPAHDGKVHVIEVRVSPRPAPNSTSSAAQPAYRIDYRRAYTAPAP
jgi:VWFA-related protein